MRGLAGTLASLAVIAAAGFASLSAQAPVAPVPRDRVTFSRDVAPILFTHCASCHRPGEAGPFSLLTYEDARRRARLIADVTGRRVMPPWPLDPQYGEFAHDRRLSPEQIDVLSRWVADGLLEGDASDLPSPPAFTPGWQLGPPDLIVSMPVDYTTSADGPDVFRNFVLPAPVTGRRWVQAVEMRPGNPRVVHHARILLDNTGASRRRDEVDPTPGFEGMDPPGARFPDGQFLGWAAGTMPSRTKFPWALESGNDIVIHAHLKPTGRPEPIRLSIGLYFADAPPARLPVLLMLGSHTIDIAPGEAHYEVTDTFTLPVDAQVLRVYPHAHYLAKEMTVIARLPDGADSRLMRIGNWDLNWQDEYEYARPVDLPQGSTIVMRYVFDNSAANPRNPKTPPVRVRFGPEATDEMAELLLQVLPRTPGDAPALHAAMARKALLMNVAGEEKRVADDPDNFEARNNLGVYYHRLGRVDDAVAQFHAALASAPRHASAHYNLAVIALGNERIEEAAAGFERAITNRPDYVEAYTLLGVARERLGRVGDAESSYRKAIAINPDYAGAQFGLGRLLLQRGLAAEATAALQHLVRLMPEDAGALDLLAAAYAATGQFELATRTARAAVALATKAGIEEKAIHPIRERLELYERQLTAAKP